MSDQWCMNTNRRKAGVWILSLQDEREAVMSTFLFHLYVCSIEREQARECVRFLSVGIFNEIFLSLSVAWKSSRGRVGSRKGFKGYLCPTPWVRYRRRRRDYSFWKYSLCLVPELDPTWGRRVSCGRVLCVCLQSTRGEGESPEGAAVPPDGLVTNAPGPVESHHMVPLTRDHHTWNKLLHFG